MFYDLFDVFSSPTAFLGSSYPPYNIHKPDEDTAVIEMAVAGFTKDELTIEADRETLTVSGKKIEQEKRDYLHRGLAYRSFKNSWDLGLKWKVEEAKQENGILTLVLKRLKPEMKTMNLIPIL